MIRTAALDAWAPRVLSILRIVAGLSFMSHGMMKILHFPASEAFPAGQALPPIVMASGVIELVCGALLVLGFLTRPAAFIASGMCAVGYWMAHGLSDKGFIPANNGGETIVLYCFIFLYLVFAGGGAWSVDAYFNRRRPLTATVH